MAMSVSEAIVVSLLVAMLLLGLAFMFRRQPGLAAATADWDRRVRDMPQHADLRAISERLSTVERVCDVVRAEVSGMKDAIGRVERTTNMLLAHQLKEDRA